MEKYGYIYLITNIINGKVYVGLHVGNYDKYYYGSGKIIKKALKKYGKENFTREILIWCNDKISLDYCENFWINVFDSKKHTIGYNIMSGGKSGGKHSDESKQKMRESTTGMKHTDEAKRKISESKIGIPRSEECIRKRIEKIKGVKHSEEHNKKISESLKGNTFAKGSKSRTGQKHTEKSKEKMRASRIGNTNRVGKLHSEESKKKIGEKSVGRLGRDEKGHFIKKLEDF